MDPYAAPKAKVEDVVLPPRSVFAYPGWYAGVLMSVFVAAGIGLLVTSSLHLFEQFGAELPWLTRALVVGHGALWLGPLICVASAFARGDGGRRAQWSLRTGLVWLVVMFPLSLLANYLPIFSLAAAI